MIRVMLIDDEEDALDLLEILLGQIGGVEVAGRYHEGKPANTATIIEELWPAYDLNKAKSYMYTCMSYLRRSLAENNVPIRIKKADQGFIALVDGVEVDLTAFERLLRHSLSEEEMNERLYDQINLMYKGEYMDSMQRVVTLAPDSEVDGRALIKLHLGAELEEGTVQLFRHALDYQTERQARGQQ